MSRQQSYNKPGDWETRKRRVLQRDEHRCYLGLPGCTGVAVTADHVIPVTQGGTHDLENLAAICGPCHEAKSNQERAAGRARRRARVGRNRPAEQHPNARQKA